VTEASPTRGLATLSWVGDLAAGCCRMIDQTLLPGKLVEMDVRTQEAMWDAIKRLAVRGAPAIGVAAAMGIALGARDSKAKDLVEFRKDFDIFCETQRVTRPTAVNLFWAIQRMREKFESLAHLPLQQIKEGLVKEAQTVYLEDIAANQAMGKNGAVLMPASGGVLTHCNAGALATAGYGTALGVIRAAVEAGKKISVYVDETRPFLQGSRLTAWELMHDGISTTLISDNMAGHMMKLGKIQAVVVGADRIAANGDTANKIGTYTVAILAKEHGIPFYVAAPWSTVDMKTPNGEKIPIEQRSPKEVTHHAGKQVAPDGVKVENPAFDVTPGKYITAIITERGVAKKPFGRALKAMAQRPGQKTSARKKTKAKTKGR